MIQLGRMKKIDDLRQVWAHEALEFTPWLAKPENMKLLGETIGMDIEVEETESDVDGFSADIVAIDTNTGKKVIIENQLEDSNHTHLGQIITYAAGKSAATIIWIVKHARDAHKAAVEWLNNHSDEDINFFLIEIELWQINDSLLAPKFNIVEEPNNWTKEIKKTGIDTNSATLQARLSFWNKFNEIAFLDENYRKQFRQRKPSTDHWYDLSIGTPKCHIAILYLVQRNEIVIELYISNDKALFDKFYQNKDEIEAIIGQPLDWRKLPEKKASRILLTKQYDLSDSSLLNEEIEWIKEYTLKYKQAFKKFI